MDRFWERPTPDGIEPASDYAIKRRLISLGVVVRTPKSLYQRFAEQLVSPFLAIIADVPRWPLFQSEPSRHARVSPGSARLKTDTEATALTVNPTHAIDNRHVTALPDPTPTAFAGLMRADDGLLEAVVAAYYRTETEAPDVEQQGAAFLRDRDLSRRLNWVLSQNPQLMARFESAATGALAEGQEPGFLGLSTA